MITSPASYFLARFSTFLRNTRLCGTCGSIIRYASSHINSTRSLRSLLICSQHHVRRLKYCVLFIFSLVFCKECVSRQIQRVCVSMALYPFHRKLSLPFAIS